MDSTLPYFARIDWPPAATVLGAKDWKTRDGVPDAVSFVIDKDGRLFSWDLEADKPARVTSIRKMTLTKTVNRVHEATLDVTFDAGGELETCVMTCPPAEGKQVLLDRSLDLRAKQRKARGAAT
jgi:hypothetical protein